MSAYVGLPPPLNPAVTQTKDLFQALDNFTRVFAIQPGERVLMLTDPLLDPRVAHAAEDAKAKESIEVRNNAIYRISWDGPSCAGETFPNFPNGIPI